jgi:MFS family permease
MPDSATKPRLTRAVTLAMAVSSGAAVANLYYNQPILGLIAHQLPGGARLAGLIPTATQAGYAAGMLLLVPLGDTLDRRKLILWQTLALAVALAAAALAPDARGLILASLAVGLTATIAQMIVPFAAELAAPGERGAVVGTVMSGVLAGILLGRALAGVVAEQAGWRAIFWLGSIVALLIAGLLARLLPRSGPGRAIRYGALLASLLALLREEPALRRASLVQAAQFAGFNAFWTTLAFRLQASPLHLGAGVARARRGGRARRVRWVARPPHGPVAGGRFQLGRAAAGHGREGGLPAGRRPRSRLPLRAGIRWPGPERPTGAPLRGGDGAGYPACVSTGALGLWLRSHLRPRRPHEDHGRAGRGGKGQNQPPRPGRSGSGALPHDAAGLSAGPIPPGRMVGELNMMVRLAAPGTA